MKIKIFFIVGIMICLCLCACMTRDNEVSKSSGNLIQNKEKQENDYDIHSFFGVSLIYEKKLDENVILHPKWLSKSLVSWVSKAEDMGQILYQVHIVDIGEGIDRVVYEREIESGALDIDIAFLDDSVCVYFFDYIKRTSFDRVVLDADNWKIISEETFDFSYNVALNQKSVQDIIIAKDFFSKQNNTFNWDIILFSLNDQESTGQLQQGDQIRYDFTSSIWSLSGDYFILVNYDAMGMDRFESLVDLFAYPKTEWPVKLQYDVFDKNGGFEFSFTVDFIHHDDGSETTNVIFWIPGDQIFAASTFYDVELDSYYTKEQLIDASGEVIGEWSYDGYIKHSSPDSFDAEGVYYGERKENSIHLMYKSFYNDEAIDYGPVIDFAEKAFISPRPNLDENFLLLIDHERTLKIFEMTQ